MDEAEGDVHKFLDGIWEAVKTEYEEVHGEIAHLIGEVRKLF